MSEFLGVTDTTTGPEWGQSFVFDGFGNLTQQVVTKGSAPSMTLNVNPANNRVTGSGIAYDAAGNLTSYLWPPYNGSIYYDLANRAYSTVGGSFRYTARNERLTVLKFDGTREVHMRGLGGEMIGVYRIDWENGNSSYTKPVRLPERERVYAAGRLLFEGGQFVATDRLGSVAYKFGTGLAAGNGGFESYQLTPWASYGSAQISISNVSRTGGQSMRLTTPVTDYGAYQDVKGLVAGMSYQFQAWVRAELGTNLAVLAVCEPAGGGFVWTGAQTVTTEWRLLTVYFTATSNGTARIILAKYDTTGALLWDDVELVNGATATSGLKMRYYPYGQEVGTATANDVAKFGTYTRDSGSGLDYAMNRYYQSTWGRFTTADPYRASGGPADPGSWNRYAYVQGDPVNWADPTGLQMMSPIVFTYMQCGMEWVGPWDDGRWRSYCNYGFSVIWDGGGGGGGSSETNDRRLEPGGGGGIVGPADAAKKKALDLSCNKDVREAMNKSWMQTGNGSLGSEAGFRLDGNPGDYTLVMNSFTNERNEQKLKIVPGSTFAIFHVHPNTSGPKPSTPITSPNRRGDTWIADRYSLDMFVISSRGLWYYDHTLKESFELQSGMDWAKPCP